MAVPLRRLRTQTPTRPMTYLFATVLAVLIDRSTMCVPSIGGPHQRATYPCCRATEPSSASQASAARRLHARASHLLRGDRSHLRCLRELASGAGDRADAGVGAHGDAATGHDPARLDS